MNQRVTYLLIAGLLWIAPRALAVSEGAPPPPPTWRMGEVIDEPLTIPQEGVVVIRAVYETYGGFYGDATATYAVRVTNSEGEEIAGSALYTESETLTWRADSPPLTPGEALTMHLELTNAPESNVEDLIVDLSLSVSVEATPALIDAANLTHTPDVGNRRLDGHSCLAPSMTLTWSAPTELPDWMHRLLSYSVSLMGAEGDVLSRHEFGAFDTFQKYTQIRELEELQESYCAQLSTSSLIDDEVVIQSTCLDEQDFTDLLSEDEVLCTVANVADHQLLDAPLPTPTAQGCGAAPSSMPLWLIGAGLLLMRRRSAPLSG